MKYNLCLTYNTQTGNCSRQLRNAFLRIIVLLSLLSSSFAQNATILDHGGGTVRTVEFSPVNGFRVASAGEDKTIKIWNLRNNTVIIFEGHTGAINSVAFSPDGRLLASGGENRIKLWNLYQRKNIATLEHIPGAGWGASPVQAVTFSPDGKYLASAGYLGVKLWDVRNYKEVVTLQHDAWVLTVAFSPNGQFLASGDAKGKVKVWNIQTQQVIAQLKGDTVRVDSLAFSPDGRTLASSGYHGLIKLWAVSDWTLLGTLQNIGTTYVLDFSPDGKTLASTGYETVNLWAVESGQKITSLAGHTGWVRGVAFTPTGNSVASGGEDGTVRIQKIKTHLESQHIRNIVRLIYFVPLDRFPQPDIDAKLDAQIRDVQQFYADQMEHYGFGRKTFRFETDVKGKAIVHYVNGKFTDSYYHNNTLDKVWEEIHEQFDRSKNIYLVVIDIGNELIGLNNAEWCGTGGTYGEHGGRAILPASGICFIHEYSLYFETAAHELGHAFGLQHDFRNDAYLMSYGTNSRRSLSLCAAEWLDAHKYFNTNQTYFNKPAQIEMLPPLTVEPHGIRLRFKITDPERLHQAQLIIPTTTGDPNDGVKLHSCQSLSAQDQRIEFVTSQLITDSEAEVTLQVMDTLGNFTSQTFPFDTSSLLPQTEVVSIPDPNLEASVRETLNLPPKKALTQFDLLSLAGLDAKDRQITDLTGLQHARNIRSLNLSENQIRDISSLATLTQLTMLSLDGNQIIDLRPLAGLTTLAILSLSDNQIVDLTPLSRLTNLSVLQINNNQIVNITPLTPLTNLLELRLPENQISDITPLSKLANLTYLDLSWNQIPDIMPLAKLTDLKILWTAGNQIVDISPLINLTNLTRLSIHQNHIRDISALAGFVHLEELWLAGNHIRDMAPLHALLKQNPDLELDIDISQFPEGISKVVVSIPDANLEEVVRETLDLMPTDTLTQLDMLRLTGLNAHSQEVSDLTGIEYAKNLRWLWFSDNHVVNITPLATLVNLERLSFWGNEIGDISSLANLTRLRELWMQGNHITDLKPLTALTNLERLEVSSNQVIDISPLSTLTQLTYLNLSFNQITDITPVATLTKLTVLLIDRNQINDISPLASLVNLERVRVAENPIVDMLPLLALVKKSDHMNLDILNTLYPLEKITGPWLWIIAPTETGRGGAASIDVDSLDMVSNGALTENHFAINGAKPGDAIGDYVWTLGEIAEHGSNNVNDLLNKIGLVDGGNPATSVDDVDINDHSSYTLITLESAIAQPDVIMLAGSDDAIKVWLNGEVVHKNQVNRGATDFQDIFKVDLKAGDNLLLVKVSELWGDWSMFVGIDADVKVKQQFTNTPEKITAAPPSGADEMLRRKTALLPNYPNPFNPETWIPYQLAESAEVTVHIYATSGALVRTLTLGHQFTGIYQSRSRAAYWDGRNDVGEAVASGVYFYTFTAGNFFATRKMLILK